MVLKVAWKYLKRQVQLGKITSFSFRDQTKSQIFQIMRKIMLFFENYATFFKYAFQKNEKHETISSCIYIVNAA